jgi:aspartokinase/homoserine dehydrogenase 1
MKILKFGGTSVGTEENVRRIREIVLNQRDNVIVVVSAMGGVTDQLLTIARKATSGEEATVELSKIWTRHEEMTRALLSDSSAIHVIEKLRLLFDELEKIIQGVRLIGELTPKILDKVLGFGERMSSVLISSFLEVQLLDSAALIRTDQSYGKANVDFEFTYKAIKEASKSLDMTAVAPGFVSSSADGSMTTLGRGGSDYTAALFAAALNAKT